MAAEIEGGKLYDTVIIIDSNFDIKELKETLKSQDVYNTDDKGKGGCQGLVD